MIRDANSSDVTAVVALEQDCQGEDAWSENLIREGIGGTLPTVSYLVAQGVAGVSAYAVASYAGDIAELQRIGVRPGDRRGGLGRDLVEEVARRGGRSGAERLLLEVRADNEVAITFYAGLGFGEIGRRESYYRDGEPALVLGRALERMSR